MFGFLRGAPPSDTAAAAARDAAAFVRASECVRSALRGGEACAEGSDVRLATADAIFMDTVAQWARFQEHAPGTEVAPQHAIEQVAALFAAAARHAALGHAAADTSTSTSAGAETDSNTDTADAADAAAEPESAPDAGLYTPGVTASVRHADRRADHVGPVVARMADVFWLPERRAYVLVPGARAVATLLGEAARDYAETRAALVIGGVVARAAAHVREHGPTVLFGVMELAPGEWEPSGHGAAAAASGPQSLRGAAAAVAEFCYRLGWGLLVESGRRDAPRGTATLLARLRVERVRVGAHAARRASSVAVPPRGVLLTPAAMGAAAGAE